MALVVPEKDFQFILRVLNTNLDGRTKVPFSFTSIRGIGRRFAVLACKKADVDAQKRAGELKPEEIEKLLQVIQYPRQYKIPDWFLNRQRDIKDGSTSQLLVNQLDTSLREDYERMKKMRLHRGIRHFWGYKVRGQHTKSTGRGFRTQGVLSKK